MNVDEIIAKLEAAGGDYHALENSEIETYIEWRVDTSRREGYRAGENSALTGLEAQLLEAHTNRVVQAQSILDAAVIEPLTLNVMEVRCENES